MKLTQYKLVKKDSLKLKNKRTFQMLVYNLNSMNRIFQNYTIISTYFYSYQVYCPKTTDISNKDYLLRISTINLE